MTSTDPVSAAAAWLDPTLPAAERVERLLREMTLEEKVAQLGSRWVGNDMRAHETEPDARCRPERRPDAGRVRGGRGGVAGRGEPARAGPAHPRVRQRPVTRSGGCGRAGPAAADGARRLAAGHPGGRPRGVPHRVHHLRRDGLPGRHRLGRDLRPRPGGAHGRRDRQGHGRARRAPGALARARRRARLPLGPGRGDHGRGPLPRRRRSAAPTCAACRARASSPRSSTSPGTPPPGRPATTGRCRWGAASSWTSCCRRSRRP